MKNAELTFATTKKKYTSFDIALLAGVSQPTVSRALNGSKSVTEATRQRIVDIARRLDYQVDLRARRLRTQQTGALTLLIFADHVSDRAKLNPFLLSMLGAITRAAAARGYDLLVTFQQLSHDWFVEYEKSRKSDGLILLGYGDFADLQQRIEQLTEQGTHFIRWGAVKSQLPGLAVGCNNIQGGRTATEHLVQLGRKKIVFLGDNSSHSPEFFDRFHGYREALKNAGIKFNKTMQINAGVTDDLAGFHAVQSLIERGTEFDGIVAASDAIAISAIRALIAHGIAVPSQVAVVGFDDIPMAGLMNPPLTTIRQDVDLAGELLIDGLIKSINQQAVQSQLLDTQLVVRESCGAVLQR